MPFAVPAFPLLQFPGIMPLTIGLIFYITVRCLTSLILAIVSIIRFSRFSKIALLEFCRLIGNEQFLPVSLHFLIVEINQDEYL